MVVDTLQVNEIFYSIQGESTHAGRPCVFVRLAGCPLCCTWCDTAYARRPGRSMTPEEAMERVRRYPCRLVEFTGGEPLAQPPVLPLMARCCDAGYEVLLETSGSLDIGPVDTRVRRIMDLKCPGSGMSEHNRWDNIGLLTARDEVKFVVADRTDYEWGRVVMERYDLAARCPVLMAPVSGALASARLAAWMLEDGLPARLQLQLHKCIWGPGTRRV
jgi:7-carboxy-7-deazaguanine synthase